MGDCLFCKMVSGEVRPNTVCETDELIAFRDINPQAPVHVLIVPRRHLATLNELEQADAELIGKMVLLAKRVARDEGLAERGYRLVLNCNPGGGQTVFHIHLHLLGGRQMTWPPG